MSQSFFIVNRYTEIAATVATTSFFAYKISTSASSNPCKYASIRGIMQNFFKIIYGKISHNITPFSNNNKFTIKDMR